jgi:uncharacterized membrane protein HdeD (DUF308 family)
MCTAAVYTPRRMPRFQITAIDQPGWVWRAAIGVVVFIIALPLIVLVFVALLAGAIVFGMLAAIAMLWQRIRRLLPGVRHDGRENVRVIVRRNGQI